MATIPNVTAAARSGAAAAPLAGITDVDCLVVGGGIVGLATAYALQRRGHANVLVLDKAPGPGAGQTGHNSGVIHSGLYYAPGSYKARLCVAGAAAMRDFCADHGVSYRISGKLVVAVAESELPRLAELERRGNANGVAVRRIGPDEIKSIEPHAAGLAALYVASTGVADYVGVCRALVDQIVARGGEVRWGEEVSSVHERGETGVVTLTDGTAISAGRVVVCAGLQSDRLSPTRDIRVVPFRGGYVDLTPEGAALIRSMIYPVPDPRFPFLGVHFTRHFDDSVSAGPNAVLHLARERYRRYAFDFRDALDIAGFGGMWKLALKYWQPGMREVVLDISRKLYLRELQRYVPELEAAHLSSGAHVGIRAQAVDAKGTILDDFAIVRAGPVLHVLNAPSPAATASLAIGDHLATMATTN